MRKSVIAAMSVTAMAQNSAPPAAAGASAPTKQKRMKKPRHKAASAVNPETSVFKQGGN